MQQNYAVGTPTLWWPATFIMNDVSHAIVVPPRLDGLRECRRLQAFVAVRNSEKAMVIFEKAMWIIGD